MMTSPTLAWFPSANCHLDCGSGVVEPVLPGTAVEFGDQLPGGGDHDRVGVTGFDPAAASSGTLRKGRIEY